MKKILVILIVLFATGSSWALTDISLGVYGGLNMPVIQSDAKSGAGFGIRAKVSPIPLVAGALFFESRKYGDVNKSIDAPPGTATIKGGKVTVFGVEALLGGVGGGIGPHFYVMAGLGSYKWTRDMPNTPKLSKMEYHFGPGLEIAFSKVGIEGKVKFEIVPTDGGGSRKNILAYVGVNYHFGFGVM